MRFVILSYGRSGNNMLRSALNRHPQVMCHDEVLSFGFNFEGLGSHWSLTPDALETCKREFGDDLPRFFERYIFSSPHPRHISCGFRLFYEHYAPGAEADFWSWLNRQDDLYVIHLRRLNHLRQLLSLQTAIKTREWVAERPSEVPPPQIPLSFEQFTTFVDRIEAARRVALERLSNLPILDVCYEDILADMSGELGRVQSFLGVEPREIAPITRRLGGQRLEDRIIDFEALRAQLHGTPYAWMLDDDDEFGVRTDRRLVVSPPQPAARGVCTRLIAQIGMYDVDILPHWVRHYRSLGIKHFHVILHGHGLKLMQLRRACRKLGLTVEHELRGKFSDEEKRTQQQAIVDRHLGEWLLLVDTDEFLELPYHDFPATIRALTLFGVTALPAIMVQRIAADGTLPQIGADTSLDKTFPLASMLLSELMGSHTIARTKFPLFLATEVTRIQLGQHHQSNSDAANYIPISAVLHHYKWRGRLRADLKARTRNAHISYLESRAYLRWLDSHDDRLPLDGAFFCTQPALIDRGHLRRANRSELVRGALFTRIRRARGAERADPRLAGRLQRIMIAFDGAGPADALPISTTIGRSARIAIVTFELLVPDKSGGIGTWAANLAMSLRAAGHAVTIFCAKTVHGDSWPLKYWEALGIELVRLSFDELRPFAEDGMHNLASVALKALITRTWDIIHVPDALALGRQIVAAKRAGLAFQRTTIAVTLHGNNWWHRTANRLPVLVQDLELDHLEMEQMRGADVVIAPSRYMLDHVEHAYPGALARGYVSQNPLPWPFVVRRKEDGRRPVKELVFFGRLEPRKGLWTFCDALDALLAEGVSDFSVTFLGAFGTADVRTALMERIKDWPSVKVIEGFRVDECRLYLSEVGRLAVMPSHGDNSPYTILECLAAGIPFLATYVGGVPELIHRDDREEVLVRDDREALAVTLRRTLADGALVVRPAIPSHLSELRLLLWHDHVLAENRRAPRETGVSAPAAISLCLSPRIHERRDLTKLWLRDSGLSIELLLAKGQLRKEVAVFVREFRDRSLAISCQEIDGGGPTPQAHLNRLASHAQNEIIALSDSAISPDAGSLRSLAQGLAETGAAAIVAQTRLVLEKSGRPIDAHPSLRIVPSATPSLARLRNVFGAPLFAVRKDIFVRLGGLDERPAFSRAWHWEFLTRLTEAGERVAVLPFCFGSWPTEISAVDDTWPWGPVSLLEQIDGGRPTIARQQLQMLRDHLERTAPTFDRVRRLLSRGPTSNGNHRLPLLRLTGSDLSILQGFKNTALISTPDGLAIDCSDEDPKVRLPAIPSTKGARDLVVEIALRVPNEGNVKVYWRNGKSGDGFTEDRSVARYLLQGENAVKLRIARPSFPVSLRLDPGESPGRYLLRSVAVFGE